jgi:sorting nexin-1/2
MSSIAFNNDPEDNPFADPFARPRSPDPWSTWVQQPPHAPPESPPEEELGQLEAPTPSDATTASTGAVYSRTPAEEPSTPMKNEDPLDSSKPRTPSPPSLYRRLPPVDLSPGTVNRNKEEEVLAKEDETPTQLAVEDAVPAAPDAIDRKSEEVPQPPVSDLV